MTALRPAAPPPFFASLLLKIVASARDYDFAAGDLRETYEALAATEGPRRAPGPCRRTGGSFPHLDIG